MTNPNKLKSPEDIMKEIERLKKEYEKAEVELKDSKRASVTEAVRKAGVDFEEKFKIYISKRKTVFSKQKQLDEIKAEIQSDLQYLKDQHPIMRDTLVGAGAKEEYLVEVLGEPPTVKAAVVAGTTGRKRTKAKLPDGTLLTWVELIAKYGIAPVPGANQRLTWESAVKTNPNLPKVEVVTSG